MAMDEQELEVALSMLLEDMEDQGTDSHEIFLRLDQLFNSMRAVGMPLPQDLVRLHEELAEGFGAPVESAPNANPDPGSGQPKDD